MPHTTTQLEARTTSRGACQSSLAVLENGASLTAPDQWPGMQVLRLAPDCRAERAHGRVHLEAAQGRRRPGAYVRGAPTASNARQPAPLCSQIEPWALEQEVLERRAFIKTRRRTRAHGHARARLAQNRRRCFAVKKLKGRVARHLGWAGTEEALYPCTRTHRLDRKALRHPCCQA